MFQQLKNKKEDCKKKKYIYIYIYKRRPSLTAHILAITLPSSTRIHFAQLKKKKKKKYPHTH